MSKIHVISERGKLVGTFIPQPHSANPKVPTCTPVAGKGQKLHELEIENAEAYYKERRRPAQSREEEAEAEVVHIRRESKLSGGWRGETRLPPAIACCTSIIALTGCCASSPASLHASRSRQSRLPPRRLTHVKKVIEIRALR